MNWHAKRKVDMEAYEEEEEGADSRCVFYGNSDDEIEGLNNKLIDLLSSSSKKHLTPEQQQLLQFRQRQRQLSANLIDNVDGSVESATSKALCNTESENDGDSLVESCSPDLQSRTTGCIHACNCESYATNCRRYAKPDHQNTLPPIGVFWDIENCQVPRGRSATAITQLIRERFFTGYREAEFIVVCDVQKENRQVVQQLNDAQVNLIHVAATCKNAADEKLRQSLRRFADIHGSPSAIILISGDINFAADLSDLRHRKRIHVILLHMENTSEALILCANEHYNFSELTETLPSVTPSKNAVSATSEFYDLLVYNLPKDKDTVAIKRRLKQLSANCGGRVIGIRYNIATVRFSSHDTADRAQKRMDGEYVYDSKITVRFPKRRYFTGKNFEHNDSITSEPEVNTSKQMYTASASIAAARNLPITPHFPSSVAGSYTGWGLQYTGNPNMLPPPVYMGRPFTASNGDGMYNRCYSDPPRAQSPVVWPNQQFSRWDDQQQFKARDTSMNNGTSAPRTPEGLRRIRGTHGNFNQPNSEWNPSRQNFTSGSTSSTFNTATYTQTSAFKRRSPSPMYGAQGLDGNQWSRQSQSHSRTPSPYENSKHMSSKTLNARTSPYQHSDPENEEVEKFFNPINHRNSSHNNSTSSNSYSPVELQVTNLDQNIEPKEMKLILAAIFMEHVMVLHTSIFMQSDGNYAASVKVPTLSDAQYAISQLHRRKIGFKRILISYAHTGGPNPQLVRSQIVMLLQEVPGHKLPLFKFREMYESRFMISVSVSDLYKMKDVCIISEDPSGRMVSLNPDHRNTPSPCLNNASQEALELPYCTIHTKKPWSDKGWAEQEMASLPNVKICLKLLKTRIHHLLTTHNGSLPLPSMPNCYEAEFNELLPTDENGVPLEHLVSCLSSVELKQSLGSVKYIGWAGMELHDDSHDENKCISPPLANQLALFSRELVDLLKTAPHCQLLFNRFIPAYHHHFGRQCRVADYGFTKLIDLLEALTHTVQVMGEGNKRMVTLSHRAQVRRFTSDLLRVLKAQASKQVTLSEFPNVYARVIGKPWDVVDYGVCEIEDILSDVSENTVVVTSFNEDDKMIAIPKREQTPEEIERTKQFATEVIELLRHAPQCRMLFNKFVPSYHHHFGHQCRVSDYGFTKLIELFEAIPDIVKIEDVNGGERRISLTEKEGLRVLSEQISKIVSKSKNGISVSCIAQSFLQQFGYALRPELFNCSSMLQLMEKLYDTVKVVHTSQGSIIFPIVKTHLEQMTLQCRRVLMDQPKTRMPVKEFQRLFTQYFGRPCNLEDIRKDLHDILQLVSVSRERWIELTPLQSFACNLYRVLMNYGGSLNLSQFEAAYSTFMGTACKPMQYGFANIIALLQALPCTVVLKDNVNKKKVIYLSRKLGTVGIPLPPSYSTGSSSSGDHSSNESLNCENSLGLNQMLHNGSVDKDHGQWSNHSGNTESWKQNEELGTWKNKPSDAHWSLMEQQHNWSLVDSNNDCLFNNLMRTPLLPKDFPSPPKPDSPAEDQEKNDQQWKASVWSALANFTYPSNERSTNIEVPPLTLPTWNQIETSNEASNLLSPTKNLLQATANPLNPCISPFFSMTSNVVAPHPSELPLPSMSLTPKKANDDAQVANKIDNKMSSLTLGCDNASNGNNTVGSDVGKIDTTPTKRNFAPGKRRLAAQFKQPIDS